MKNINKILGVILTLALLAGSLVMAFPVGAADEFAAAAIDTWLDDNDTPALVMGTSANVFTVAADGTTMFMWTKSTTALAKATTLGDSTVYVASTVGFPTSGSARITGLVPFKYTSTTPTSFTGCTNVPTAAIATEVGPYVGAGLPAGTLLTAATTIGGTSITVTGGTGAAYPASGSLTIGAGVGAETIAYTSIAPADQFNLKAGTACTKVNAIGAAVVLASGAAANAAALLKSTDAGKTWTNSSLTAPAIAVGDTVTMLEVCPTDLQQLVAVDNAAPPKYYRSINGGKDWQPGVAITNVAFGLVASTAVRALDIAQGPNGPTILLGTDIGVATYNPALGSWTASVIGDVYAAALSPDYLNDEQVIAVVDTGANIQVKTKLGSNAWDADIAIVTLLENNTTPIAAITSACLAFPSNYYWGTSNQVFVGITDAGTAGDVYRVNGAMVGSTPSVKDCGADVDIFSIAVSGTKADSTVIASKNAAAGIIISTDADTASAPSWTVDGIKSPIGINPVLVRASTGILYAGDADATHSGFYTATDDFKSFNGISRMEIPNIYTYTFSRGAVKDTDTTNSPAMYYFKNAGNWEMRHYAATGYKQVPTGTRGAPTMFAVTNAQKKQVLKTTDFGLTWNVSSSPGNKEIEAFTAVDDNTYFIGYAGYIRSNTGAALPTGTVSQGFGSITMVGKTGILIGLNGRIPATWMYSKDSGATFDLLGTVDQFAGALASKYVVSQGILYVVDKDGVLWTWTLASSTSWKQAKSLTTGGIPLADLLAIKTVDAISDTIFIGIAKDLAATPQVYRSLPANRFDFRPIPGTDGPTIGGKLDGLSVYDNADGTFNIKPTLVSLNKTYPANIGTSLGKLYCDTTIGQIKLSSPAEGAQINNPIDLSWKEGKTTGSVRWEYEVARDEQFDVVISSGFETVAGAYGIVTDAGAKDIPTGQKYFWRVRVNMTGANTLNGLWSDPQSFTVKTVGNTTNNMDTAASVYPPRGEVNISTSPVLTWGNVQNATYNIKIATDSAFTAIVEEKTGLTVAIYQPSKKLDAGKVYFWEVQAVSGGIASDWVAFAFTTAVPAVPVATAPPATVAPPQTIVIPTPTFNVPAATVTVNPGPTQAPATPAYIWFIIVIGAVLVIAVIVLIVRTRRV